MVYIYATIFLAIDDQEARSLAENIIQEKYEHMCYGWFTENLSLQKYTANATYEFSADSKNGTCNVTIFMWDFWQYDSWIGVK